MSQLRCLSAVAGIAIEQRLRVRALPRAMLHFLTRPTCRWLRGSCAAEGGAPPFDEASVPMDQRTPVAPELLGQEHQFLISTWSDGDPSRLHSPGGGFTHTLQ